MYVRSAGRVAANGGWTVDGEYVEKHDVSSRKAARDGSWDELRLRLDIVADWRDAVVTAPRLFFVQATLQGACFYGT